MTTRSDDHVNNRGALEEALEYARLGLTPIVVCRPRPWIDPGVEPGCYHQAFHKGLKYGEPCHHPGKVPLVGWKDKQSRPPSEGEIRGWFEQWPTANVAIVTGAQSGIGVLDADSPEAIAFIEAHGGLDGAPSQMTGKGRHWFFGYPEGASLRNAVGLFGERIDFRGEGGIVVVAPSVHQRGTRYRWVNRPSDRGLPPVPEWLLQGLREASSRDHRETKSQTRLSSCEFDVWSHERLDLEPYLDGLQEGGRNNGLFRLACKLRGEGMSLELARTFVHLANQQGDPLGDDEVEAILSNVWKRYPDGGRGVYFDLFEDGGSEGGRGDDGPMPFPVDALPEPLARLVREAADAVVAPPEFVAVPLLVAAGAVIGRRLEIALKKSWTEGPNLFAACVGSPGSKKTPAMKAGLGPLNRLQSRLAKEHRAAVDEWKLAHQAWEKEKFGPEPPQPPFPHLLATDATVEALVPMLASRPGVALEMDELVAWVRAMNQYKAGGKGADRQHFLSAWSRSTVKVDRRGRMDQPIMAIHPCLSVVGGIQPDLLPSLADASGDDGFLDRILWAYPEPVPDHWTDDDVSSEAVEAVNNLVELINGLAYDPGDWDKELAYEVRFDAEAKARWVEWYEAHSQEAGAVQSSLKGVWAKMPSQLARLALILHAVATVRPEDPSASVCDVVAGRCSSVVGGHVSLATLEAAIALIDYFEAQARKVYGQLRPQRATGQRPSDLRRRKIIEVLSHSERMSQTELLKEVFHGNISGAELGQVLDELEEEGVIVREVVPGRGARPTTYWRLGELSQAAEAA